MKRVKLLSNDLGAVRFMISPLANAGLSLRAARVPDRVPVGGAWIRASLAAMPAPERAVLTGLTNSAGAIVDFVTPPPVLAVTGIDDELEAVRATPPDVVAADLAKIHPHDLPVELAGPSDRTAGRVADALHALWDKAFEPRWDRMRGVLETDLLHRGRAAVRDGLRGMLHDVCDRVHVLDGAAVIEVDACCPCCNDLSATPLRLAPSLFADRTLVPADPAADPFLVYPARGAAAAWENGTPPGADERADLAADAARSPALRGLLGRARAELLAGLADPDSSTRIAARLGVTTSAANQHLRALRDAGLVTSRRCGRDVLYQRSPLGNALVTACRTSVV